MQRALILLVSILAGCTDRQEVPPRTESPQAAFVNARAALAREDLKSFFDALTEPAARELMANSISICLAKDQPAYRARYRPSEGCDEILGRYGWPGQVAKTPDGFRMEARRIRDPRGLATELEANHRKHRSGTSFSLDHLDGVKLTGVIVNGSTARAVAEGRDGEKRPVVFEKDVTGWRFDPYPELSR